MAFTLTVAGALTGAWALMLSVVSLAAPLLGGRLVATALPGLLCMMLFAACILVYARGVRRGAATPALAFLLFVTGSAWAFTSQRLPLAVLSVLLLAASVGGLHRMIGQRQDTAA